MPVKLARKERRQEQRVDEAQLRGRIENGERGLGEAPRDPEELEANHRFDVYTRAGRVPLYAHT